MVAVEAYGFFEEFFLAFEQGDVAAVAFDEAVKGGFGFGAAFAAQGVGAFLLVGEQLVAEAFGFGEAFVVVGEQYVEVVDGELGFFEGVAGVGEVFLLDGLSGGQRGFDFRGKFVQGNCFQAVVAFKSVQVAAEFFKVLGADDVGQVVVFRAVLRIERLHCANEEDDEKISPPHVDACLKKRRYFSLVLRVQRWLLFGVFMNSSPVVLLDAADRRPAKEAQEWFGDGLRLLRMRLAQWTLFSALAVLALFFAGLLGSSVVGAGGEKLALATLPVRMLLVNVVVVAVQCGMYRAMTRVVQEGGSVRIDDMLWLFSAAQRRQLLMFAVLLTGFNVLFVLLEHWLLAGQALIVPDAQGEFLMGRERVSVNMEALVRYSVLWTVNTLLVWALTWAVLPLMTMFSSISNNHVATNTP